jgi:hypothetical protein
MCFCVLMNKKVHNAENFGITLVFQLPLPIKPSFDSFHEVITLLQTRKI